MTKPFLVSSDDSFLSLPPCASLQCTFPPQLALAVCALFMTSSLGLAHQPGTSSSSKEVTNESWSSTNTSMSEYRTEECRAKDPRRKVKTGRVLIANEQGKPTGEYIASAFDNFGMALSPSIAVFAHDSHRGFWYRYRNIPDKDTERIRGLGDQL
jgi:hypothetical protein